MKNSKTLFSLVMVGLFSLSTVFAQSDLVNEGFSGTPDGWTIENTFMSSSNNGLYEGAKSVKLKNDGTTITTSAYNNAAQLSYYFLPKKSDNAGSTILVQKSIDGGTTWTDVHTTTVSQEQADAPGEWYKDSCDINEATVMIKISSTPTSSMYLDDLRLTQTAASADNADLDSIKINDGFMMAEIGKTDYVVDLYYVSEVVVDGTAVSPNATVSVVQPTDIFSDTEADRTAVISIKSEDETVTTDYNVLFNIIADTLVNENFGANTLVSNYTSTAQFMFTTPSNGNTLPESADGSNVYGFVTNSAIEFKAFENIEKLSFKAALRKDESDDFEIKIFKYTGADSTLLETLTVAGSGLTTDAWKEFSVDVNETAATRIKFITYQTSDNSSRICIDDVVLTRTVSSASVREMNMSQVKVYPNPAQDQLNIYGVEGQFMVNIYGLNGVHVLKAVNNSSIDISAVPSGCYLVKVQEENSSSVQKLIVE